MRKVPCPICHKTLMMADDNEYIDFDLRFATNKVFCQNCKRKIKYSGVGRNADDVFGDNPLEVIENEVFDKLFSDEGQGEEQ